MCPITASRVSIPRHLFDVARHARADGALFQHLVPEVVRCRGFVGACEGQFHTLRDDHQPVPLAAVIDLLQVVAHRVQVYGRFGDENPICAAANPRVQRDPARMPSHHLQHDDSRVRLGGVAQPIHRLHRDGDRAVEPEGEVRAA
jgi:hypothetical protein